MLLLRARVDLWGLAIKEYSAFPKALDLQKLHLPQAAGAVEHTDCFAAVG